MPKFIPGGLKLSLCLKNKIRILLRSNVNDILNNQDYLEHFDVHPAVSIFIKIVNENGIDITYRDDFEEYFSIDLMTAFINKFNAVYNSQYYKKEVSKEERISRLKEIAKLPESTLNLLQSDLKFRKLDYAILRSKNVAVFDAFKKLRLKLNA